MAEETREREEWFSTHFYFNREKSIKRETNPNKKGKNRRI